MYTVLPWSFYFFHKLEFYVYVYYINILSDIYIRGKICKTIFQYAGFHITWLWSSPKQKSPFSPQTKNPHR